MILIVVNYCKHCFSNLLFRFWIAHMAPCLGCSGALTHLCRKETVLFIPHSSVLPISFVCLFACFKHIWWQQRKQKKWLWDLSNYLGSTINSQASQTRLGWVQAEDCSSILSDKDLVPKISEENWSVHKLFVDERNGAAFIRYNHSQLIL